MPQHLALPIKVTASGRLATVEQDSVDDISQSVALLIDTRPGDRRSVEEYGIPDPVFGGVDVDEVTELILEWEDRADQAFVEKVAAGVLDEAQVHADTSGPSDIEVDTSDDTDDAEEA
jgi:phage baseplate assembly protein W